MVILTKQEVAHILKHVCTPCTIQDTLLQTRSIGVIVDNSLILRCINGIYYLDIIHPNQSGAYCIYVDGILYTSQSSRTGALAYADKLCQLLFGANEVKVTHNASCLIKWVRIPQRINQWVQRYV